MMFFRPFRGWCCMVDRFPALTRWARIYRPSGALRTTTDPELDGGGWLGNGFLAYQ